MTPLVQENEENAIVFDELRETCRLVERRHLGLVGTWVKVTSQAEVDEVFE